MQDGKSCDVLTGFRTEQYADGRIVAFRAFQFIIHSHIHIHLSYVLMGDFSRLQIICCVVNYVGFTSEKLIHKGFF